MFQFAVVYLFCKKINITALLELTTNSEQINFYSFQFIVLKNTFNKRTAILDDI